jgi:hypothetical protein
MKHSALGWCFSYISHYIHVAPAAELVYAIRHPKMRVEAVYFFNFPSIFSLLGALQLAGN